MTEAKLLQQQVLADKKNSTKKTSTFVLDGRQSRRWGLARLSRNNEDIAPHLGGCS